MTALPDLAVILARGLGTRMRRSDPKASLDSSQAAAADSGLKALIPIKRPFLDYVLSTLADAGYRRVCLVIGPEHDAIRDYYGALGTKRIDISFAVQEKPLGTADAVRVVEPIAGGGSFVMLNSDNYYPVEALAALRLLPGAGLAVFERESLIAQSNISAVDVE